MTARNSNAFLLSGALHVLGAGLLFLLTYSFRKEPEPQVNVFELVAGAGDNYMATVAPALGSPDGINVPKATPTPPRPQPPAPTPVVEPEPAPTPMPVAPKPQPAPVPKEKAPTPVPVTKKDPPATKATKAPPKKDDAIVSAAQMAKNTKRKEDQARQKAAAERAAAERDAAIRAKADAARAKFAPIDTKGIRDGVVGGSTANTKGGAGGTALTVPERDAVDNYTAMLLSRLQEALNSTPNLDDGLSAEVEVRVHADGRVSSVRVVVFSKNKAFDDAIQRAIRSVSMPAPPKGMTETLLIPFGTRAKS